MRYRGWCKFMKRAASTKGVAFGGHLIEMARSLNYEPTRKASFIQNQLTSEHVDYSGQSFPDLRGMVLLRRQT